MKYVTFTINSKNYGKSLGAREHRQQVWCVYLGQKPGKCFIKYIYKIYKITPEISERATVSLESSDKSKATGGALTVKTDTAVLISTKDNEM